MSRLRQLVSVNIPDHFRAWFLQAYRHPLPFLSGLGVLPLVLIIGLTYQVNANLWRRQTLHNLGVTARLAAEIIKETLEETLRFERMLIAQPGIGNELKTQDRARLTHRLQHALTFMPRVDRAMLLTLQGQVVAAHPNHPGLIGSTVAEREPFRGAQQSSWRPYVSAVYLREGPEAEKVVGVMWPISQGDQVIGLLQAQHRVEEVKSWLQKIRIDPQGFLYVVDQRDQLVVFPFQVLRGQPKAVSDWPPVAKPMAKEGTTLVFRNARDGKRWLAAVYPVESTGWRVVAVQPERAALRAFDQVFWSLGMVMVFLVGLVVAAVLRWAQLHTLSLRLMRQNAKLLKQLQQHRLFERGSQKGQP